MADFSYIGVGKVYMREAGTAAGLIEVGNVSALNFKVNEETKELKDFTQGGGGTYNEVRRVSSVECSMTMHDLNSTNLARAVFGTASAIAAGAVTNEEEAFYKGALAPTDYPLDTTVDPVVDMKNGTSAASRANTTAYALNAYIVPASSNGYYYKVTTAGTSGGSVPTYPTTIGATVTDGTAVYTCMGKITLVKDTDYTVTAAGLVISSAASITDGEVGQIDYTKKAGNAVEALLSSAKEYELFFAGVNDARSGKAFNVNAYRVKLGATQALDLIGEDFAGLELTGKVLKDSTKNGTSASQYFKAQIVT